MSLWDDVGKILTRLSNQGWQALLLKHGLDLNSGDLRAELLRNLGPSIKRDLAGFLDFSPLGARGIEPGDPARSLLYHALASPLVHPTPDGNPVDPANPNAYPTLEELDTIENLIYALSADNILTADMALAVFAYEYRPASGTPLGGHADLVFARTGLARNGTKDAEYDPILRCYRGIPSQPGDCLVSPSKYGVFLARRLSGDSMLFGTNKSGAFVVAGGKVGGDGDREFLVPVHKLFNGPECLASTMVLVEFHHRHVNEKLRRAVTIEHGIRVSSQFDLAAPPFQIVSESLFGQASPNDGPVRLEQRGSLAIVGPVSGPLITEARQRNPIDNTDQLVTFTVPKATFPENINRRFTSLRIAEDWLALAREGIDTLLENVFSWLGVSDHFPRPRNAPEFVNIRHQVDIHGNISDMRKTPPLRGDFQTAVKYGGYQAALFVDGCADGCVTAKVTTTATAKVTTKGPAVLPPIRPAFSIIAPPDFFPSIDQAELMQWLKARKLHRRDQFRQGGPEPLSQGRLAANQDMTNPLGVAPAFQDRDETMVAMVAWAPRGVMRAVVTADTPDRTSYLPDASSTVFAPGWDVTYAAHDKGRPFYATYGLGSPFPEDAKLCAAANSFWPAVSPDASRTFGRADAPTAMPLMDDELGYHAGHP